MTYSPLIGSGQTPGKIDYLCRGRALVLLLAGADCLLCSICARKPSSRSITEGRSVGPSTILLIRSEALGVAELVLVSGESRPDRESFFDGAAS